MEPDDNLQNLTDRNIENTLNQNNNIGGSETPNIDKLQYDFDKKEQ